MAKAKLFPHLGTVILRGTGLSPGDTYRFDLIRYEPGQTTDYPDKPTSADPAGAASAQWEVPPTPAHYVGVIYGPAGVVAKTSS